MSTSAARVVTALRAPRESVPVVTQVRSTLLSTSLGVVRERGLWDRYREGLSRAEEESMVSLVPGSWVPVELALAHYDAMERLAFAPDEQLEIGKRVTFTIQRSVLGTLVRLAAGAGATPWDALSQFHRLWDRVFQGGDGAVYQLGPKDARIDLVQIPLLRIAYFRNAMRGLLMASAAGFCRVAHVREVPGSTTARSCAFRLSWA
jgi:hypothetical protein